MKTKNIPKISVRLHNLRPLQRTLISVSHVFHPFVRAFRRCGRRRPLPQTLHDAQSLGVTSPPPQTHTQCASYTHRTGASLAVRSRSADRGSAHQVHRPAEISVAHAATLRRTPRRPTSQQHNSVLSQHRAATASRPAPAAHAKAARERPPGREVLIDRMNSHLIRQRHTSPSGTSVINVSKR